MQGLGKGGALSPKIALFAQGEYRSAGSMEVCECASAGAREYQPAPRSVMMNKGSTGIAIDRPGELAGLVVLVCWCVGVLVCWCVVGLVR